MPERTSYPHGTPNWVDLATTDIAATAGTVLQDVFEIPPGRAALIADPVGATSFLLQPADPSSIL